MEYYRKLGWAALLLHLMLLCRILRNARGDDLGVVLCGPHFAPELNQGIDYWSVNGQAALQPRFPADVAARHERVLAVDDHEFGMQNTEWPEEEALDLQVKPFQVRDIWQSELGAQFLRVIDAPIGRRGMQEHLQCRPR